MPEDKMPLFYDPTRLHEVCILADRAPEGRRPEPGEAVLVATFPFVPGTAEVEISGVNAEVGPDDGHRYGPPLRWVGSAAPTEGQLRRMREVRGRFLDAERRLAFARSGAEIEVGLGATGWRSGDLAEWLVLEPTSAPPLIAGPDGTLFSARDRYCIAPTCPCADIAVEFLKVRTVGASLAHTVFVDVRADRVKDPPTGEAAALIEAFREQVDVDTLRARHERAQAAGRIVFAEKKPRVANKDRNKPCPCGSGKKAKKCCSRPGAARHKPLPKAPGRIAAEAARALTEFINPALGLTTWDDARAEFCERFPVPFQPGGPDGQLFLGWLLYDWSTDDGRTVAERYLDADPDPALESFIRAAVGAPFSVHRVVGKSGHEVEVLDLFRPEWSIPVDDPEGARALSRGDLVLAKVVLFREGVVFEGAYEMPLAAAFEPALLARLKPAAGHLTLERLVCADAVIHAWLEQVRAVAAS